MTKKDLGIKGETLIYFAGYFVALKELNYYLINLCKTCVYFKYIR